MLVLTRRKEETIVIGDSIEITVLGIRGEQVRLGISAPPEVSVHRKEVYDSLVHANRTARPAPGALRALLRVLRRHGGNPRGPGPSGGPSREHHSVRPANRGGRGPDKRHSPSRESGAAS